jgi:hypothetical protein
MGLPLYSSAFRSPSIPPCYRLNLEHPSSSGDVGVVGEKKVGGLYGLYYWMERWLVESNPLRTTNWPFTLAATIILFILVFWILSRKAVKSYFGENNE